MSRHTPGPWRIFDSEFAIRVGIEGANNTSVVAFGAKGDDSGVWGETTEESKANARLIASAPELLWALGVLLAMVSNDPKYASETAPFIHRKALEKARQAIAKAGGKQ